MKVEKIVNKTSENTLVRCALHEATHLMNGSRIDRIVPSNGMMLCYTVGCSGSGATHLTSDGVARLISGKMIEDQQWAAAKMQEVHNEEVEVQITLNTHEALILHRILGKFNSRNCHNAFPILDTGIGWSSLYDELTPFVNFEESAKYEVTSTGGSFGALYLVKKS